MGNIVTQEGLYQHILGHAIAQFYNPYRHKKAELCPLEPVLSGL